MITASQAAAEARRQAAAAPSYYNLKLGPTYWTLAGGLGIEATDNANYQGGRKDADLIFRPELRATMVDQISERNTLNFSLGVGYSKYIKRTDLDRVFLTPGSEIAFNVFIKDWVINLHDRFSIQESTYQNPAISQTGNYSRLENVAGLAANYEMEGVTPTFGFDHENHVSLNSTLQQADGQVEVAFGRVAVPLHQASQFGIESGASLIDYSNPVVTDAVQDNAGFFYEAQLTEYLGLNARMGWTFLRPQGTGTNGITKQTSSPYFQIAANHRLNQFFTHTLAVGYTVDLGIHLGLTSGTLNYYFVRWNPTVKLIHDLDLSPGFLYENGSRSGSISEHFSRVGFELTLTHAITKKLTGSLGYRFIRRESDRVNNSYTVNSVLVNMRYRF